MVIVFGVFFLYAGTATPGVNEVHYLGKAKHYWDREWCRDDFFLNSADAHQAFYWSYGWTTRFLSLPMAAWCGRIVTWMLLAWSFVTFIRALLPPAANRTRQNTPEQDTAEQNNAGPDDAEPDNSRPVAATANAPPAQSASPFRPTSLETLVLSALLVSLLHWTHMAGEWVIGGIEAKGFAYALVWFGLAALVRGRWNWVWISFGAAAAFHVLVGGWAVLAAAFSWLFAGKERSSILSNLPGLLIGGALSLAGLLPGLALTRDVAPNVLSEANFIYTFQRLSHHLLASQFAPHLVQRHIVAWGVWLVLGLWATNWLARPTQRLLFGFVLGTAAIALCGIGLEWWFQEQPRTAAKLLRYYWFRLSDATLPIGLLAGYWQLHVSLSQRWPHLRDLLMSVALLIALSTLGVTLWDQHADPRPPADRQLQRPGVDLLHTLEINQSWQRTCAWIRNHTTADSIFLTPRDQQTFRWYAERAEVANWKDVPQNAAALVQWWKRQRAVYFSAVQRYGLTVMNDQALRDLCRKYQARYMVVDIRRSYRRRPGFRRVYPRKRGPQDYYEVYDVNPPPKQRRD